MSDATAVAAVELSSVTRTFRRPRTSLTGPAPTVNALSDVDLVIPQGSAFGIVGESGSGKSTLMRIIAGLDRASSGTVRVDGVDITALPERQLTFLRRTLQMVFQDPMGSLNPRMTIGQIVAEPLQVIDHADIRGRVAQVLERVGLDPEVARRYPHQFSGGQRQRISIARAIAPEPRILIADEAVSALDVTVRAQILELIAELTRSGDVTLIFVSHDLAVIRRSCDQVAVLRGGQVVESGPTEQVYSDPQQEYTRALLAAAPTLERSLAAARARGIELGRKDTAE